MWPAGTSRRKAGTVDQTTPAMSLERGAAIGQGLGTLTMAAARFLKSAWVTPVPLIEYAVAVPGFT